MALPWSRPLALPTVRTLAEGNNHRWAVDGNPVAADVFIDPDAEFLLSADGTQPGPGGGAGGTGRSIPSRPFTSRGSSARPLAMRAQ